MEYLDKEGGKYLATKLKSYVDNKVTDLPSGGTVDLTNYYTKEETDQLLANLPSGGTGTKGDKGDTGVGVSSIKLVNYELIITLTDGTVHNLGNVRGEKGIQGDKGADGTDGTNGKDGAKGADGVSPTVSVTETTNGHTVAITDVNGTQSFNVLNGKDGKDGASGGSSGGGSAITYAYDTEIATGETWVDGKPIYLKVFHIDGLESQSSIINYKSYCNQTKFAETIISVNPTWNFNNSISTGFWDDVVSSVITSYKEVGDSVNNNVITKMMWCIVCNDSEFYITIGRGKSRYNASCDVFVKYTKL